MVQDGEGQSMAAQLDPIHDLDPQGGWILPVWTYSDPEWFGESIIVVRGRDRALRAFSNACRHGGSRPSGGWSRR
jgi:nitrite reductase/ring-hydroxylating ferredoxin subunit